MTYVKPTSGDSKFEIDSFVVVKRYWNPFKYLKNWILCKCNKPSSARRLTFIQKLIVLWRMI